MVHCDRAERGGAHLKGGVLSQKKNCVKSPLYIGTSGGLFTTCFFRDIDIIKYRVLNSLVFNRFSTKPLTEDTFLISAT